MSLWSSLTSSRTNLVAGLAASMVVGVAIGYGITMNNKRSSRRRTRRSERERDDEEKEERDVIAAAVAAVTPKVAVAATATQVATAPVAPVSSINEEKQSSSVVPLSPVVHKKPVIAVDLDEVLGEFLSPLILFLNETYKMDLKFEQFNSYHFVDVWGGTDEESNKRVHEYFDSPYFADIPVIPGSLETLLAMKNKFDFVIVTSRQHMIEPITRRWIATHFPGIFTDIISGNHYGATGKKLSKPDMCTQIGAIMLIDDSIHYASEVAAVLPQVILFDWNGRYGWNQIAPRGSLPSNVTRLKSWAEIRAMLEQL